MRNTTASEIAALLGGEVLGDGDLCISGVSSVTDACEGDIVLAEDKRYFQEALSSGASCVLTSPELAALRNGKTVVAVNAPGNSFVKVLALFASDERLPEAGIHPSATVEEDVTLGKDVAIGANCYISQGARLGDGCALFPNTFVGEGVSIGSNSKLYPSVTIYHGCVIGSRVTLHAGVVIGADGFGYRPGPAGLIKLPHAGTVIIGDDVEIGANSAVDRGKTGATSIGNGTKIDNLVHIAHNVKIGSHCIVVALSGVAGSVEIGNGVTLAAQSGIKDHVHIGDGAVIAARAGVIGDIDPGMTVSGFPAREHKSEVRVQAARLHLPEIMERVRALEREVKMLRNGEK